ncbi:hypothetical protein CSV72_04815 [Sporosarcina sp. P20a]|nr:hypothetical protein CSV72_04815 [Sporosarcina sp. P20a]
MIDTLKSDSIWGFLWHFLCKLKVTIQLEAFYMSKIIFNEHRRRQLDLNPSVYSVLDWMIQHIPEFETFAVNEIGSLTKK